MMNMFAYWVVRVATWFGYSMFEPEDRALIRGLVLTMTSVVKADRRHVEDVMHDIIAGQPKNLAAFLCIRDITGSFGDRRKLKTAVYSTLVDRKLLRPSDLFEHANALVPNLGNMTFLEFLIAPDKLVTTQECVSGKNNATPITPLALRRKLHDNSAPAPHNTVD